MRTADMIVALDVPDLGGMRAVLDRLGGEGRFAKVGLELFTGGGWAVLEELEGRGSDIFLDLKFHDIPRTVERAVTSIRGSRVRLLTIHAAGGREMVRAAVEAAKSRGAGGPKVIAVTTLTSLGQEDLTAMGVAGTPADQALRLGELALAAGADGLVTSVLEVPVLRQRFGEVPLLVTPGIRPAGGERADQKRVATPAAAVRSGADYLVVGRPIVEAVDPAAAARAIRAEMAAARGG